MRHPRYGVGLVLRARHEAPLAADDLPAETRTAVFTTGSPSSS